VRFYKGATGLKTGTTNGAGSCLSATATRDSLSLIAVVMGCPTSDERFASAKGLLDYGFANFTTVTPPPVDDQLMPVRVLRGVKDAVTPVYTPPAPILVDKMYEGSLTQQVTLSDDVKAPVDAGQVLGMVEVLVNDKVVGSYPLVAGNDVEAMNFLNAFKTLSTALLTMNKAPKPSVTDLPELTDQLAQEPKSGAAAAAAACGCPVGCLCQDGGTCPGSGGCTGAA